MDLNLQAPIGTYIRELRKSKNISINNLVSLSGISKGYISQIENNKFNPSPEILKKIAAALETDYFVLMNRAGYIETLGETIQDLRHQNGWSIEDLEKETLNFDYGEPIFLSKFKLLKLENNEYKDPSVYELYLLSKAFKVSPQVFSTVDLQTPKGDLIALFELDGLPDPIKLAQISLDMYKEEFDNEVDEKQKEYLVNRIDEQKSLIRKYISQLNSLSANGSEIIKLNTLSRPVQQTEKLFELDESEEYAFSFDTPVKHDEYNGKTIFTRLTRKECEMSFFDVRNLLYLDGKVNFEGKILSKKQKEKLIGVLKEIM